MDDAQCNGPPPLPANHGKPLEPVASAERIASLDVLRGLALLGILIANMMYFAQPMEQSGMRNGLWFGWFDRFADWLSLLFVEGKFYPLFSILFGYGFSMQMERAKSRALDPDQVYRRRLFVLMGFGLAHGIFLWDGDVLFAYGLCGFTLMYFRNRKPRTLLIWAVAFITLTALFYFLIGFLLLLFQNNREFAEALQEDPAERNELIRAYVTGGYVDAVIHRLGELVFTVLTVLIMAPGFLGLFLVGLLAGKLRIITGAAEHRGFLTQAFKVCFFLGLAGNFLGASMMYAASAGSPYGLMFLGFGVISIFGPMLTVAYIAGIALLMDRKPSLTIFAPIAAAGRMALTNYLAQSLIATMLFYGYGFGLAGEVGRLGTIVIALLIFAAQVVFSTLWLRYHRYGPMEWLWRSLTYGAQQPKAREIIPPP